MELHAPRRNRETRIAALALFFLALGFCGPSAHAGTDPDREWVSLTAEHFTVHTYDGGEALGRRVAAYAEEAWTTLTPVFDWIPKERIHIAVIDDVDSANGFAGAMPYDAMTLFAHPPSADHDLGNFDDWMRILVLHEFTHILHLDHAEGLPEVLNTVLGKTLKPNQMLPRWVTEGIAVWIESTRTDAGRVGAPRSEMLLRAAVVADALPELDELTGGPLAVPRGSAWYLIGGALMDFIAREAGDAAITEFVAEYGQRVIPFGLNTVMRRTSGANFGQWYDRWHDALKVRFATELAALTARGVREGTRYTTGGEQKRDLRFSPDGASLYFVRSDRYSPSWIVKTSATDPGDGERFLRCEGGCRGWTFTPDGQTLIVATTRPYRRVNRTTELVRVSANNPKTLRDAEVLTQGARTQSPAFSRRDGGVWVVRSEWGATWLERRSDHDGAILDRWDPPTGARLDHPAPSPDGRSVFLSMHHEGVWDLVRVDLETRKHHRLTHGGSIETHPQVTADGRWLVYSSGAGQGAFHGRILNIFARNLETGRTHQITDTRLGAYGPRVSPDGRRLAYIGWTLDGEEVYTMPFVPQDAPEIGIPDPRPGRVMVPPRPVALIRTPYTPTTTMAPRRLGIGFSADLGGFHSVDLSVGGVDIANHIALAMALSIDIDRADVSGSVALTINTSWPTWRLSLLRYSWDRTARYGAGAHLYREEVWAAALNMSLPLPDTFVPMAFEAGFSGELTRGLSDAPVHTPDSATPRIPREGFAGGIRLSWVLDDTEGGPWSIAPQSGSAAALTFRLRHPLLGGDRTAWSLAWRVHHYITMPWLESHILALSLRGAIAGGTEGRVGHYALGGVPEQDVLSDLFAERRAAPAYLRGYPVAAFRGPAYHLATAEYRLPIWRMRRGLDILPLFLRDLSGAIFVDAGLTHDSDLGPETWRSLRAGVGVEIDLTLELLYGAGARFRLGYAYGLGPEGVHQVYFLLAPRP